MQRGLLIAFALMLPSVATSCGYYYHCDGGPEDVTDEEAIDALGFSSQDVIDRLPKEELAIEITWQPAQDLVSTDGDVWGVETLPSGSSAGTLKISPTGEAPLLGPSSGRSWLGGIGRNMTKREFATQCEDSQSLMVPTQVALGIEYRWIVENSKRFAVVNREGLDDISIRLHLDASESDLGGFTPLRKQPPLVSVPEGSKVMGYIFDIELGGESPQGTLQATVWNGTASTPREFVIGTWKTVEAA